MSMNWLYVCVLLVLFWPVLKLIDARFARMSGTNAVRPTDVACEGESESAAITSGMNPYYPIGGNSTLESDWL